MNIDKLLNMTPEEVIMALELVKLDERARILSKLVFDNHKNFGINEHEIQIWTDGTNVERLTHSGVWKGRYNGKTYTVVCTPNGIYEALKADYLVTIGQYDDPKMKELAIACKYFKAFIARIEQSGNEANALTPAECNKMIHSYI